MKRILLSACVIFFLSVTSKAQYVTIPDLGFRNFLKQQYPGCFNAADMMDTTCSSIVNERTLIFTTNGTRDLTGIRYFKRLRYLDLSTAIPVVVPALPDSLEYLKSSDGSLDSFSAPLPATLLSFQIVNSYLGKLPVFSSGLKTLVIRSTGIREILSFPPNLDTLDCSNNPLTYLPALPAGLLYLNYSNVPLYGTSLTSFPSTLQYLYCNDTYTVTLPTLPGNLILLSCGSNSLTTLPALPATLSVLSCNRNALSALPALPAGLQSLYCQKNYLTNLPVLPPGLVQLSCSNNSIANISGIPASLRDLAFNGNLLTALPAIPNELVSLDCSGNILELNRLPDSLKTLNCSSCQLSALPALPAFITNLTCNNNQLSILPLLPNSLIQLDCSNNQLTSLPNIPTSINQLRASHNLLSFLPALPAGIEDNSRYIYLDVVDNNIYCLPKLTDHILLSLDIDSKISCLPNKPVNLYLQVYDAQSGTTAPPVYDLPLCNPTNNINQCQSFPVISGRVFYDYNNNGVKDANELFRPGVKMTLSNGISTYTDNNGYFEVGADSLMSYTITATAPPFYNVMPTFATYIFSRFDTLVTKDYALQANTSVDSLSIRITALNWAIRPGFGLPYQITYENVGTTTLNPNISFNYNNALLIYNSVSNPSVVNTGSALTLAATNFRPGETGSFIAYFRVQPTAPLGDSLASTATISANSFTTTVTSTGQIGGSFDPNDKRATPELTPAQVAAGEYIEYTVRFQNTGTDTAFNIVITDTLSSKLQASTLQMLEASHLCKTTLKNNVIYFEFLNVLLPDSNINEVGSHGFVTFRIKPQPTVVINSNIPNKAAIYFDYNLPVITNTALTEIRNPVTPVPLRLMAFTANRESNNMAVVYWTTANEFDVSKFVIEMSVDGINYSTNSFTNASGRPYNSYSKTVTIPSTDIVYLRLKMIDIDGRFTYSQIVILRKNKSAEPFTMLNNPVKGNLIIAVADNELINTTAIVINAQGLVVKSLMLTSNQQTIDTDKLPAGVYVLKTLKGSGQFILVK